MRSGSWLPLSHHKQSSLLFFIYHSTMSTLGSELWTSKLGNKYPKEEIERNHDRTMKELDALRRKDANALCADCGQRGTLWSSVNLGVFLCLRCGSLHRAVGTHVSKPKGCTGTYMWGEDEIARMKDVGNERANKIYGGTNERPSSDAPDSEWLEYIRQKYDERKFSPPMTVSPRMVKDSPPQHVPTANLIDLDISVHDAKKDSSDFFAEFGL